MGFAKISLLLFYRRIFITSWFQRNSALLSGIIACFSAAIILVCLVFLIKKSPNDPVLVEHLLQMARPRSVEPDSAIQRQHLGCFDHIRRL